MELSVPTKKFYKQFKKIFVEDVHFEHEILDDMDKYMDDLFVPSKIPLEAPKP